jgi:DnaJ-class molecular chaperone
MYDEFNNKNYYEILNAHEDSWPMVIVKAFKTLQTNETDRFKLNLYQTAYDVLIDPDKRKKYDLTLKGN